MNNAQFINDLNDTCKAILKEKYPVFSEAEYQRRFSLIETVIKQKKLDKEEIQKEVEKINKNLTKVEKIKKFFISDEKFSIENGMQTPTMKLKRFKIIQKYKNSIEKLYQ